MQPNKPYFEVSIISKSSKKRKIIFLIVSILLIISILIYTCLKIFYVIDTGALNSRTYHYIYVETDALDATSAEKFANTFRVRGAAGLTLKIDGKWRVLLSLYPDLEAAQSVSKQLSTSGTTTKISSITTARIHTSKMNEQQKSTAKNIYEHYIETIDLLYNTSIALDSSTMTESSAQVRVNQLLLLWQQRTQTLANTIDITSKKASEHALIEVYNLSMQITGLLAFLADENDYSTSLLTYTSIARKTTLLLAQISF